MEKCTTDKYYIKIPLVLQCKWASAKGVQPGPLNVKITFPYPQFSREIELFLNDVNVITKLGVGFHFIPYFIHAMHNRGMILLIQ